MRVRKRFSLAMLSLLLIGTQVWPARADLFVSKNSDVTKGNALLSEGKVAEALERYDEAARALPGKPGVHLNRGLALSRMGEENLDQAMQAFQLASEPGGDKALRARALYNLGNAFFKKEDYAKALELYKKSLLLDPGNKDVAWNMELGRALKKKKEEEQKKQQEKQDQQGDQEKQDQQGEQEDPDQKSDEQKKDDQGDKKDDQEEKKDDQGDKKEEQKKPGEDEQQPEQPKPQPKTKQEMEQVLNSLDDQQKNLMKQMARQKGVALPAGSVKDW